MYSLTSCSNGFKFVSASFLMLLYSLIVATFLSNSCLLIHILFVLSSLLDLVATSVSLACLLVLLDCSLTGTRYRFMRVVYSVACVCVGLCCLMLRLLYTFLCTMSIDKIHICVYSFLVILYIFLCTFFCVKK